MREMTSVTELTEAKIPLADPTKTADSDKKARCVSRIKIVWAFTSFLISAADVLVIIWLSYLHFSHSSDLIAWLMLLPILLNFIGIFTFLSNENERREMEEHGCKRMKNLMFFPVIGPAVSTLRYFVYTLQEENAEKAERLESLIIKMKQYESFFRAAPEAFIQITFRIITWSSTQEYHAEADEMKYIRTEYYWTSVCLALCLFTLAETNMYGCAMPYYRMFEYSPTHPWSIEHISIPWRIGLFFFAYFSIGSRIFADSIFKASFCFYFEAISFGEVIIICFITQFFLRASIYAFFNGLGPSSEKRKIKLAEQGVYGAFTYSWKSLFLSFDFQAYEKCIFLWFYIENVLMIGTSYTIVYAAQVNLDGRYLYHIYAVSAGVGMIIAISLRFALRNRWKRKHTNKVKHVSSVSDDSTKETV